MPDINLFPTLLVKFYFSLQNRPLTASVVFGSRLKHGCSSPAGRGEQHALYKAGRDRNMLKKHVVNKFFGLSRAIHTGGAKLRPFSNKTSPST